MAHTPILCHMEEGHVIDRTFIVLLSLACALSEWHKVSIVIYACRRWPQGQGQE